MLDPVTLAVLKGRLEHFVTSCEEGRFNAKGDEGGDDGEE